MYNPLDDEVEEIRAASGPPDGGRKREGSSTKLANFGVEEDINIVRAWLEISCDPIINTGQKKDNFWKPSNFASIEGHKFPFMHCWELLKDEPKWQDVKQKNFRTVGTDASPSTAGKRPSGRDAAKSRKKKCPSGSASSSEYASKLQDLSLQKMTIRFDHLASIEEKRFDEMREHNKSILQLEQEKIKIMRDKLDMQMQERERERPEREKQEDEGILKVDLDSCAPDLRMYYEALREEILQKVVEEGRGTAKLLCQGV
ncbi:hypothetical protein BS78_04G073500 [Paspalum vaginatum]|nr:hypothetical protein BS78_04G073500 [Paspalum vaginatum]